MGIEDIFNMPQDEVAEAPQVVVEEVAHEIVQPVAEGPIGEVAPVQDAPQEKRTDDFVPLAKYLDQRDELKELRRWKQEQESRPTTPQPVPDFYDMKPEEVAAYVSRVAEEKAMETRFMMSESWAKEKHGGEVVDTATAWAMEKAKSDPTFVAQYMTNPDPVGFIVRQHKRDSVMQQIGEDPDEYVKRRAAELGLTATTQEAAPVAPVLQQQAATPARSLASSPSLNGGVKDVPVGPMTALSSLFK